ncbi:5701_t:CDS:2 [Acaulospora colombiana]|uniref:5701_t:CDS:1 n=1 Tax=Acaulospora colombiana TaxID=27376 RepID=A0ACA9LCL9_9GLOM|nr:5701_t:CDS:2 [Acaulospora colombiana]
MPSQDFNLDNCKVSLYAYVYDKHIDFKNLDGSTEFSLDKYTLYDGRIVVEFKDYREQKKCDGKRAILRKNHVSVWDDILRLNQATGSNWTYEQAIQMEAKLLLKLHPTLDLEPDSTLQGMKLFDPAVKKYERPVHRKLKRKKRKLNSYELKQAEAKRIKQEKMMWMMDERHGRDFKPDFNQMRYFRSHKDTLNKGKKRADLEPLAELGRGITTIPKRSFGTVFRTLTFERLNTSIETDNNKAVEKKFTLYTFVYIYRDSNDKHMVVAHTVDERDLKATNEYPSFLRSGDSKIYHARLNDNKATLKCELENTKDYKTFIKSFVVLYGMSNKLKFDSDRSDKILIDTITQLTSDYSSMLPEKQNTLEPLQIVEYLPIETKSSTLDFKINDLKIESINDLVVAATRSSQNKVGTPRLPQQDQVAMPPPSRPPRRPGQIPSSPKSQVIIQNIGSQTQVQMPQTVLQHQNRLIPNQQRGVLPYMNQSQISNHLIPQQIPQQMAQFSPGRPSVPVTTQVQMVPRPPVQQVTPVKRPRRKNSKPTSASDQPETSSQGGQLASHPQMMQISNEQNQSTNQSSITSPAQTQIQIGMQPVQHSAPGTPILVSGQNQQSDITPTNQLQGTPISIPNPTTPIQIPNTRSNPGTPTQVPTYVQVRPEPNSVSGASTQVSGQIQGQPSIISTPMSIQLSQQPKNNMLSTHQENPTQNNSQPAQINSDPHNQLMTNQAGQIIMSNMQNMQAQPMYDPRFLRANFIAQQQQQQFVNNGQGFVVQQSPFQMNPQMQLEIQNQPQMSIPIQLLQRMQGRQVVVPRPNLMVQQRVVNNPQQIINGQWIYQGHPGQQPQ